MKWKNLVSGVEPFGWIVPGMKVESDTIIYQGLLCTVIAALDEGTGKWDAHLKIAYPPIDEDEEILSGQFWKNFAEPFDISEEAITTSLVLGKQLIDGEQVGLNDFLTGKRTDKMWEGSKR